MSDRTIYMTRHGSHAYGTSLPTSDVDIRGIFVAPKVYYLGATKIIEQVDQREPDLCIFELRKFLRLAAEANPNVLELLFTDPEDHIIEHKLARTLIDNRQIFITRRVKHTFHGYAHAQMKRIKTHRKWLLNPVEIQPTRKDFNLPERTVIPADQLEAAKAMISKRVDEWTWHHLESVGPDLRIALQEEFTRRLVEITSWSDVSEKVWLSAGRSLGFDENFLLLMDQERRYHAKLREFQQYQEWKRSRNQARAELEAKHGFDSKHAMHLVRLARCCVEVLRTGVLQVRRHDAEELLSIRNGAWDFDQLLEWFEKQSVEIEKADIESHLPNKPDIRDIDDLCMAIAEQTFIPGWTSKEDIGSSRFNRDPVDHDKI